MNTSLEELDGPRMVFARLPEPGAERTDVLEMAIGRGIDVGQRPKFWRPSSILMAILFRKVLRVSEALPSALST